MKIRIFFFFFFIFLFGIMDSIGTLEDYLVFRQALDYVEDTFELFVDLGMVFSVILFFSL